MRLWSEVSQGARASALKGCIKATKRSVREPSAWRNPCGAKVAATIAKDIAQGR